MQGHGSYTTHALVLLQLQSDGCLVQGAAAAFCASAIVDQPSSASPRLQLTSMPSFMPDTATNISSHTQERMQT